MKKVASVIVLAGIILTSVISSCKDPEGKEILSGVVHYANTTIPVSGVLLTIDGKSATTGSDGKYSIIGIRDGVQTLSATKDGFDNYSVSLTITIGNNNYDIEMTSYQYSHNLKGIVISSAYNLAISFCQVVVLNPDGSESNLKTQTSSTGYYQILSVPQGNRTVRFSHNDHDLLEVTIFMANSEYELNMVMVKTLPTVTTVAVTDVSHQRFKSGGDVLNEGSSTVTARGICWSTNQHPTINDSKTSDNAGMGSFISQVCGLLPSTTYYLRAYATNSKGTSYGNQLIFTTTSLKIGDSYLGGKVAYILQPGDPGYDPCEIHGLIAAPSDQGSAPWGCYGTLIGGTGTAIGTGASNTAKIISGCSQASIAARLCDELVLGGYNDWYLPSKEELNKLYLNRAAIGGFASAYYWSSSESNSYNAWNQYFYDGNQSNTYSNKSNAYRVRAVRAF